MTLMWYPPSLHKYIIYIYIIYIYIHTHIHTHILLDLIKQSLEKFREAWGVITADKSVVIFFFVVFLVGVSSGVIENFAYMRISEVCVGGKDKNVLGKIRLISST